MLTLLELLQDGRFHSGQALGAALGVSRSAVWKQLQHLQAELNLSIHRVPGRGYCLERPLSMLNLDELSESADVNAWPIVLCNQVDSTNTEALRRLEAGRVAPFVVLAERQLAGRGRRGREWISPFAENLYYSLLWRIDAGPRELEGLSLVVGLAVLQALRCFGIARAGLKWPNDILINNQKIAGILLELVGDPADVCHVVVGVGVNVNMQVVVGEIDQPWTSMQLESGGLSIDRNAFARELSRQLCGYLAEHRRVGFSGFVAEWEANHLWQGHSVRLATVAKEVCGVVCGIEATGALRLSVDGVEQLFSGGEISLRLRDDS